MAKTKYLLVGTGVLPTKLLTYLKQNLLPSSSPQFHNCVLLKKLFLFDHNVAITIIFYKKYLKVAPHFRKWLCICTLSLTLIFFSFAEYTVRLNIANKKILPYLLPTSTTHFHLLTFSKVKTRKSIYI